MANRPKLNRIWASANSNLRRDPGDAKYVQGWVSEIPTYQVLNYLQNRIDTTILAIAERGIAEWGTDVTYVLNSLVWDNLDGRIYVSIVPMPDKTKAPSTNPGHWAVSALQISRKEYDAISASMNAHIADVTTNPHKLTSGDVGAYSKTETDTIISAYYAAVRAHASNQNNPHNLQPEDIDAVSASRGGVYTGMVGFNKPLWVGTNNKVITDALGFYMQMNGYSLGLNPQGLPVAGPTGNVSQIITDARFEEVRAVNEYSYAAPMPAFEVNLQNDINVQVGACNTQSVGFEPVFNADGSLNFSVGAARKTLQSINNAGALTDIVAGGVGGNLGVTIALDIMGGVRLQTDSLGFAFGINYSYFQVLQSGVIQCIAFREDKTTYDVLATSAPYTPLTWVRLVAVFDRTNVTLYWNGSYLDSAPATGSPGGSLLLHSEGNPDVNLRRYFGVRNARIWNQALTAKQISTL